MKVPQRFDKSGKDASMTTKITTFLMFDGRAEEAMNFYVSLFPDSRIVDIKRYGPGGPGTEGAIMRATVSLAGRDYLCIDSAVKHGFSFTPAISLFVTCTSDAEIATLAERLADGGQVMMPLDAYPFSRKFAWVADRFGVSWQLNLP